MRNGLALATLLASFAVIGTAAAADDASPGEFAGRLLAGHNFERISVGVPQLAWSGRLAGEAQAWANQLAHEGTLRHAPDDIRGGAGENLWMGSRGYYSPEAMVGAFVGEKRMYRHGAFPQVSTTGNWQDVGHYTQIVWRGTREVGCGLARGRDHDVLVCRYWPAGNWIGQTAF